MSTQPKHIFPGVRDPKYVDLVKKITEKTQAKKITWNKTQNGMNATVSGKMQIGFVRSPGTMFGPVKWALFSVRDEKGTEILSVNNSSLISPLEPAPEPLREAIEKLYDAIEEIARVEVEKLIDAVDRI